jgi:hypothetical protein
MAIDPEHAARFGPYANVYRPEPSLTPPQAPRVRRPAPKPDPEADVSVKAANSNTIEMTPVAPQPMSEFRPATVVTISRNTPYRAETSQMNDVDVATDSRPHARVTLQRETATFTVPVSEAVMPDSLKAAMRAFDDRLAKGRKLNNRGTNGAADATWPEVEDHLSENDRALIRRIAPPAAE